MSGSGSDDGEKAGVAEGSGGEWVTPAMSYVDPVRRSCALCGRPIARRYWLVEIAGEDRVFCEPQHAHFYTTYPYEHSPTA